MTTVPASMVSADVATQAELDATALQYVAQATISKRKTA